MRAARYKLVLLVIDMLLVDSSFLLAILLRFGNWSFVEFVAAVILPLATGFVFQYNDLYKVNVFLDRSASTVLLVKSLIAVALIYIFSGFITQFMLINPSRLTFVYFVSLFAVTFAVYRVWLLPIVFSKLSSLGVHRRRLLIVGAGQTAQKFAADLQGKKELGVEIVGFVDDALPVGSPVLNGFKVLGDSQALESLVKGSLCDEVAIAIDKISPSVLLSKIEIAKNSGVTVKVISRHFKTISDVTTTEAYTFHPTATVTRGLYSSVTLFYQQTVDIILALLGLVVLSPLFLLAAAAIKLTSRGPVFYLHERIGKNGKKFMMYKFRSMFSDAGRDDKREKMMLDFMKGSRANGGSGKVIDTSRVTAVGKFMRATSFDEFPQLINVVRGEMSLVGPRPSLPYEHQAMEEWHHARERVLPGCTGFWQVYGRGETSFDDMVVMDIYMIENMSPWLYLQLILKTFPALLFGKGAK